MRFGYVLPQGDARTAADLALEAEKAGWDGFFVWEPVWGIDAWVMLAAAAMVTQRIRLGTLLSPISRMRPWDLAGKSAAVDNLSQGRVIISVGLGAVDTGFTQFGEQTDRKIRAELMDEGLDILTGLWRGQPFSYTGRHYRITPVEFQPPPPPVQQPRIPLWVVGSWGHDTSMARALRYDGLLPHLKGPDGNHVPMTPDLIRQMRAYADTHRASAEAYDIIVEGETPINNPTSAREKVKSMIDAGATWWIETMWTAEGGKDAYRRRIQAGPPVVATNSK